MLIVIVIIVFTSKICLSLTELDEVNIHLRKLSYFLFHFILYNKTVFVPPSSLISCNLCFCRFLIFSRYFTPGPKGNTLSIDIVLMAMKLLMLNYTYR